MTAKKASALGAQISGARVVPLHTETARLLGVEHREELLLLYTHNSHIGVNMLNGMGLVIESSSINLRKNFHQS